MLRLLLFRTFWKSKSETNIGELNELRGEGENTLENLLTSILMIDYSTHYLSILRGIDPTPVKFIEARQKLYRENI